MLECILRSKYRYMSIEVSHTRDQNHVTAVRDSILEVKLCHSYSGTGRYVMETMAANLVK